jgi:hypothetical protein
MENLYRLILLITGLVHILPFSFLFFTEQLQKSYGVDISDANLQLLLRHRAIFFGLIGVGMILSAIKKSFYGWASAIGLISMLSFVWLFYQIGGINQQLRSVMLIDVFISAALFLTAMVYHFLYAKQSNNQLS